MKICKRMLLAMCVAFTTVTPLTVHAEMVNTSTLLLMEQGQASLGLALPIAASVSSAERAALRGRLEALGVSSRLAAERVGSMTESQLRQLSRGLNDMPAGSGALGIVVTVLVIILLLEILGITNISDKV